MSDYVSDKQQSRLGSGMKTILHAMIDHLPTEFRGCQWNDGWEFEAPAVIYYPHRFRRYGCGGNTGAIENVLDKICEALANGKIPDDGGLADESGWRGWGQRFDRRRNAWHCVYRVRWYVDGGDVYWKTTKVSETYGLPNKAKPKSLDIPLKTK